MSVSSAEAAARWLALAEELVGRAAPRLNALNLFPVPDADTGSNMHATLAAARAAAQEAAAPGADLGVVLERAGAAALDSARGNSGTLLAVALAGLAQPLQGRRTVDAALLAEARAEGRTPSRIINIGTAGGLKDGVSGVFEIATVFKHDLDRDVFEDATGCGWGEPYALKKVGSLPAAGLATGDSFIRDSETRARLGHYAELVDMEGVAFVEVARFFDIPITLIKQVSDSADENATTTWFDVVDHSAKEIAAVVGDYL